MVAKLTAALVLPLPGFMSPDRGLGTILVVDDTSIVLRVTAAMLKRIGYVAIEVTNNTEALRVLGDPDGVSIDLVLLDSGGDETAALDTARDIRCLCRAMPIIFMTGFPEQHRVFKGRGVPVLQKPFTSLRLKRALREALKKPQAASGAGV